MERKNPLAAIKAFKSAFGDDPSTVLVLKYHSTSADANNTRMMRSLRTGSNVLFIDGLLDEDENSALKILCDCFVSPHRSEGFGINIAEAMALSKPVIATGYAGNTDFCDAATSFQLRYKLCEVKPGSGPYPEGSVWAEPDHDHLVECMQLVRKGGKDVQEKAKKAAIHISNTLSPKAVRTVIEKRLSTLIELNSAGGSNQLPIAPRQRYVWRHPSSLTPTTGVAAHTRSGVRMDARPLFSVIVPTYNIGKEYLEACVESVMAQSYPNWELCLCDDGSTDAQTLGALDALRGRDQRIKLRKLTNNVGISNCSNAAVEIATGQYLAFLDNDDTIHPDALLHYAQAIEDNQDADLLYCDEDKIDFSGNYTDHYLKPDWSPEHLGSTMYVLHMLVVRKSTFIALGGYRDKYSGAQDYDLALRLSLAGAKVIHVPKVLYHWRMIAGSASAQVDAKPVALQNARLALTEYAQAKYGADAYVDDGTLFGLFRVRRGKRFSPPVTLVMTTNDLSKTIDGRGTINLPAHFLQSIAEKTDYPNVRILVSSNGALSDNARAILKQLGGAEIVYQGPQSPFNFADKANFSIRSAKTEYVVLLNDDMEVRNPDWLRALMDYAQSGDVGAVGARLVYPNHMLQHVGMVIGVNETSAHVYHGHPEDTVGYNAFPRIIRNYSAVTGACMATRKSVFEEVGGFDTRFAIDFNDTDYCLRLRERGYRIVYTPFCELYHFESQTAVRSSQNAAERELFLSRWASVVARDPYFNENLRKDSITFEADPAAWPGK